MGANHDGDKRERVLTNSPQSPKRSLHLKRAAVVLAAGWTTVIVLGVGWYIVGDYGHTVKTARMQASNSFEKDLVYRRWATAHGGVYVPVSEQTPPNPYLSHIENRDVTTTSGLHLTLVNPAYMTRQVHEMGREQYGHQGHITSLKPLRPENAADAWETEALRAFERGETEVTALGMIGDQEYLRLMRPLVTETGCLKCHAAQGYEVGEVRGGISVSVPMAPLWSIMYGDMAAVTMGGGVVWLLGLGGIGLGASHMGRRIQERDRAEEELRTSEKALRMANRAHSVLSECNQALVRATSENELLDDICRILVEIGGYRLAWVGLAEQDAEKSVRPVAHMGYEGVYLNKLSVTWADTEPGRGPTGSAIRTGRYVVARNILTDPEFAPWRAAALQHGYASSTALPLMAGERAFGALNIYASEPDAFDTEEERLLIQLADDLAFGVNVLRSQIEHKREEEKAARFGRILEESLNEIYIFDADTLRFLQVNRGARENLGYTMEELRGLTALDLKPEFTPDAFAEQLEPLRTGVAEKVQFNTVHRRKDESQYPVEVHLQLASGDSSNFIAIVLDITERKQAEESLRESNERLLSALSASKSGTWRVDLRTGLDTRDASLNRLLGLPAKPSTQPTEDWFSYVHPDDMNAMNVAWQQGLESGLYSVEHRLVRRDGQVLWVFDRGKMFRDDEGQPHYVIGAVTDITDRKRAEEELRESADLLRAVHEANPDLQFVLDPDGTITSYLAHDDADLYVPPENFVGKKMHEVLPKNVGEQFRKAFDAATTEGSLKTIEYTLPMPTGECVLEARIVALEDQRFVVTVRDITMRRLAEEEREHLLHDTGERVKELRCMFGVAESIRKRDTLEQVFEDVVALIPPGWQYPEITCARVRYADREAVSEPFEETKWRQSAPIVVDGEPRGTVEVFYLEERPVLDEGPFLREERNLIDGIARAVSEAIEHEQSEKARNRLTTAIEQADETIVITDTDGTIQYANPAYEHTTGYTCEEAIGQNPRVLKSGEHDEAFYRKLWETISGGKTWEGRITNRKKDGSLYTEDASISPVVDNEGKIVNYIAVKHDVTKLIELEDQLRQAQKMEAVAQLASGVAHDFNNLLTVINGYVDLAKNALPKGHKAVESLRGVQEAADHAAGVTRSLLTFSHKMAAKKEPVELRASIEKSIRLLRHVLPAGIEVVTDTACEPVWIHADGTQLQQIIMNLAINARDAMPDGGTLKVAVSKSTPQTGGLACPGDPQAPVARLVVTDSGTGMQPEVRERMFEPFFTTKPRGQGTGLGLAIIHSIVEDHAGHIRVESEPGKGTTFTVELPLLEVDTLPDAPEEAALPRRGRGEVVLLAEDNRHVRGILASALESLDYQVVQATDGPSLMDCFERHRKRIELLVIDVDLPKRNGLECLRDIRSSDVFTPAIVITGSAGADLEQRLDEDTILLRKPFQMADFSELVGNLLASQSHNEEQT